MEKTLIVQLHHKRLQTYLVFNSIDNWMCSKTTKIQKWLFNITIIFILRPVLMAQ